MWHSIACSQAAAGQEKECWLYRRNLPGAPRTKNSEAGVGHGWEGESVEGPWAFLERQGGTRLGVPRCSGVCWIFSPLLKNSPHLLDKHHQNTWHLSEKTHWQSGSLPTTNVSINLLQTIRCPIMWCSACLFGMATLVLVAARFGLQISIYQEKQP